MAERWRIDKWLAKAGFGSRKDVKKLLKKKAVTLNKNVVTDASMKIDIDEDEVTVEGKAVNFNPGPVYLMMNKRKQRVTAVTDDRHLTVLDDLPSEQREGLFPVGRLDRDTGGLLFLTTDGEWAHFLTSPRSGIEKQYEATLDREPTIEEISRLENGLELADGTITKPAKVELLKSSSAKICARMTITEGKYHQVRRMFAAVGCHVIALKRVAVSQVHLDPSLNPGEYRPLTANEQVLIQKDLEAKRK